MNLPALCIRRPVMTTLLTGALCVFGVMSYRLLPVSDLPNIDFPTIVVSASLPGATPETMASAVATPLEQQFSTIAPAAAGRSGWACNASRAPTPWRSCGASGRSCPRFASNCRPRCASR